MIKTTLIGHACLLIQSRETTILTDPTWFDALWVLLQGGGGRFFRQSLAPLGSTHSVTGWVRGQ